MNRTFTLQRQHNNNNSTRRGYDSVVLDNNTTTTEESVTKGEEKEKRNNKKILLVDDEPDITFTLKTLLEENGFKEVDVFNEPLLALQNFRPSVYSLLITDIAMPRMDGFALYEQMRKIDNRIKVLFVTASEVNYEALRELFSADEEDKGSNITR